MTRRDYHLLAAALRAAAERTADPAKREGIYDAALAIADACGERSNFDRRKFLDACGLEHAQ